MNVKELVTTRDLLKLTQMLTCLEEDGEESQYYNKTVISDTILFWILLGF